MKKLFFQLVFSTYLLVFVLKFRLGAVVGWGIQFRIQQVPTRHTFGGPLYTKNEKYMKKMMLMLASRFFMYFLFFMERGPVKVCQVSTCWMRN